MPSQTEGNYSAEFLLSEGPNGYSRDNIVIPAGVGKLAAGAILGQVNIGGASAATPNVSGTGNGTMSSVTVAAGAKRGSYTVTCTAAATNSGTFEVKDPDGVVLGNATVGSAFSGGGIGFTISDGSTDFIVGDSFTISVVASTVTFSGTGNGTMGAITLGATVKPGVYRVVFVEPNTNLGSFYVEDPDGVTVGTGVVGTAFTGGGLTFTIADGATDFVSGDRFTITLAAGSGKWRPVSATAVDGSQYAAGVLLSAVDATSADVNAVAITRHAQVLDTAMSFGSLTNNQKATAQAQLKALGIVTRTGV